MSLRVRRGEPTEPGRLEAFSDGVFAVAITLLALDLARIHADLEAEPPVTLFQSLGAQWPSLLAFAGAFAFIGVAWTNHRNIFLRVRRVSRALNGANLVLLAGISLMPWVTANLAEALGAGDLDAGRQALAVYAAVAVFGAVTFAGVFHVLASDPSLLHAPTHTRGFAADRFVSLAGIPMTAGAALVGWLWSPLAGTTILALLTLLFALAPEGFAKDSE